MRQRAVLVLCGTLMVAAWGVFVLALVTAEGSRDVYFFIWVCLALGLTWWAAELLVRRWRGRAGVVPAALVSGVATLLILWLAPTNATLPYWAQVVGGFLIIFVVPFWLVLVATALIRRRRRNAPRRVHDERLAEKAFEERAAQKGYRG